MVGKNQLRKTEEREEIKLDGIQEINGPYTAVGGANNAKGWRYN